MYGELDFNQGMIMLTERDDFKNKLEENEVNSHNQFISDEIEAGIELYKEPSNNYKQDNCQCKENNLNSSEILKENLLLKRKID